MSAKRSQGGEGPLVHLAEGLRGLKGALGELEREAERCQTPGLGKREWYASLVDKLLPQVGGESYLVVAVVGGTNIGKSVIFNHIAGFRASESSPLASGTKHPTCLVPVGFEERARMEEIFPQFQIVRKYSGEEVLEERAEHQLFCRVSEETPGNLLILDTPDIDSDAKVNWERADLIRRSADVLIGVLTQQKYNDAAVKEFFRKAAADDKVVVVIFNQCHLPEDEKYWPMWLGTFCGETGIKPELVYLAPNDRKAAEEGRLKFFERRWPIEGNGEGSVAVGQRESERGRSLLEDLSRLKFGEIKLRTLRGTLAAVLDEERGVGGYLREIRKRSGEFRGAADLLSAHKLAEVENWPNVASGVLISEIRGWWQGQREGWSRKVHEFYNTLGRGMMWPIRKVQERIQGEAIPPMEEYRKGEWKAILEVVRRVYEKLTWLTELGNELLKPRLETLLSGTAREDLLKRLEEKHRGLDLEGELRGVVQREMEKFRRESPKYYEMFRKLDVAAAAARPATSVVLFVTGLGPIGHSVAPLITDTAIQSALHVAADVAGGTVAAAVGDTALSGTAASGVGYLEAKFRNLQATFARQRAGWLAEELQRELLKSLPEELKGAAMVGESGAFRRVERLARELQAGM